MKIYAVVESRTLDFGPTIYVGELRTEDDEPITENLDGRPGRRIISPVSVGSTEAAVFDALRKRALAIRQAKV